MNSNTAGAGLLSETADTDTVAVIQAYLESTE